jgi:hypothetical protein
MLDIQTTTTGKTYLVIAVIYTAMIFSPVIIQKLQDLMPSDKLKNIDDNNDLNKPRDIIQASFLNTLIYITSILITLIIIIIFIFFYFLVAKDITVEQTFAQTINTFNEQFWMNGNMMFAYIPILLSSIVIFVVITIYTLSDKDFANNIAFATIENKSIVHKKISNESDLFDHDDVDDMTISANSKNSSSNLTDKDWFRKYYVLLIFIASLFLYTIIFVPLWNINKLMYVKCIFMILFVLVCSMATMQKWWIIFIVYAIVSVGYFTS